MIEATIRIEDTSRGYMYTRDFAVNPCPGPLLTSPEACEKSLALLKNWLTPKQARKFDRTGSFDVIGQWTGRRYRIYDKIPYNVAELGRLGNIRRRLCFVPRGVFAIGDVMLAQKIALETDEERALLVANVKALWM